MTDVTNASRTSLMHPETLAWDDDLVARLGIPRSMLPEIRSSSEVYALTTVDGPFGGEVPIAADLGDRHAATIGQACFEPGAIRSTYGAVGVVVLNTGPEIVRSTRGLATALAYKLGDQPAVYALEGSIEGGQITDVAEGMLADAGLEPRVLRVDGDGATDLWMQSQADALGVSVSRPVVTETSTLGAAYAAGLAVGFWSSTDDVAASWKESSRQEPA